MSDQSNYWDEQALTFDESPDHGLLNPVIRDAWASLLLSRLIPSPARVADLGCGTGTLSVLLAQNGYQVSGIDLSPRMIELARMKALDSGVTANFQVGDAANTSWPEGTFDVVLSRHVLWALPDPGKGLDHWLNLLKPNGQLLLIEGKWWTNTGIGSEKVLELLHERNRTAVCLSLADPIYWGGPITDERYMVVSPEPSQGTQNEIKRT
jgi:2-polyprenyl-3-methyl-5-hydroxy-6-metoxy-1,4-benzoquinol methylase